MREKYEKKTWFSETPVKTQTETAAPKDPSTISISKPPEVTKSPQRVSEITKILDVNESVTFSTSTVCLPEYYF